MILGVTATRTGLSKAQQEWARRNLGILVQNGKISQLHHGKCKGGDEWLNNVARAMGIETHGHPPKKTEWLSDCQCDITYIPDDYLRRDMAIVMVSDKMWGFPKGPFQRRGSGTWDTVMMARKMKVDITIVFPDGRVEEYIYSGLSF